MFSLFLTGAGLATSAGLNAYLPLLVLALADRATNIVNLPTPYNVLSSNTGLLVLLLLLPLELVLDKIARIDHFSDLIHAAIRPGAAALAFMAVAHQDKSINLVWPLVLGLSIGAAVHWQKASFRPRISIATRGIANPIISLFEDALAIVLSIVAIFFSWGVIALAPAGLWLLRRSYVRMASGESRLISPFRPVIEAHKRQQGEKDS